MSSISHRLEETFVGENPKQYLKKKAQKTPLSIIMLPTRRRDAFASSTSATTKDGRALFPKQCGNARDSSFTSSPKNDDDDDEEEAR